MAFSLMLGLVCNPHCYAYDVLPLVVPAVLFFDYLQLSELPFTLAGAGAIFCPLLLLIDSYAFEWWPGGLRPFFLVMLGLRIRNLLTVAFARNGTIVPYRKFFVEPDFHRLTVFLGVALLERVVTAVFVVLATTCARTSTTSSVTACHFSQSASCTPVP